MTRKQMEHSEEIQALAAPYARPGRVNASWHHWIAKQDRRLRVRPFPP